MYECRFVTTDGDTFYFGYDYGTIFDVTPLSELDVEVSTSQGFQQVGTIVESETVGGVSREIKGVFLNWQNTSLIQSMLQIFTPGTHGKLYFNDEAYCDAVVQKTPALTLKNRKRTFDLLLYCAYPYWVDTESITSDIGGYTAAFEFPVCYDEHTFGIKNEDQYAVITNTGMVEVPCSVTFTASADVVNYGIENVYTGDFLKIDDTLESGQKVNVYWDEGRLKIEKTADGVTTNIFSLLDEDSTLFYLDVGDNVIKQFADDGNANLIVHITINPAHVGVIADG